MSMEASDRRRFPRLQAPVVFRPMGLNLLHQRRAPQNISLGGLRAPVDDRLHVGERLELEFFLEEPPSLRCWARVAWVDALPPNAGAAFEVGLEFIDVEGGHLQRLASALQR